MENFFGLTRLNKFNTDRQECLSYYKDDGDWVGQIV